MTKHRAALRGGIGLFALAISTSQAMAAPADQVVASAAVAGADDQAARTGATVAADGQQIAKPGETVAADGEIIVTGSRPIAESLAAALAIQKNSDSLVSVLAADAIGRLPDQNLAQAVSRLPGLSVQRDQGQARYVNIRGAPLNWTTLSFDGIYVISPEGRDARFDSIPSAIAGQVVVQKAVTPDLNGETIAGNVNIVTRSALDFQGLHFQSKLGAGYVDLGGGGEYEVQTVLSNRWTTGIGEVGVLLSGSYYQRGMATENFEIDWEEVPQDQRPIDNSGPRVWAREIENKFYRLTRKNWSVSGRLDWEPSAGTRLFASSIYTIFTDDELRDNYRIDTDDQQGSAATAAALRAPCTGVTPQLPPAGTTGYADICTGNTPFRGTVYGVDFDARYRRTAFRQSLHINTVGGDHEFGDVTLRWRGNYTRSKDDRSQPYLITYQSPGFGTGGVGATNRVTVDYNLTDPQNSQVTLFRTLRSAAGVLSRGEVVPSYELFPNAITSAVNLAALDVTDAYTAKAELFWRTGLFGDTVLRFGAQYDDRTKTANESNINVSGAALNTALTGAGIPLALTGILEQQQFRGMLRPGYVHRPFSDASARTLMAAAQAGRSFEPIPANFYSVGEQVWSGYAMATTRFDWGNIVYGARVEHIRNSGTANVFGLGATPVLTTIRTDQTLVFPSAHINWNPTDEMKVRLSFNTGAARPDYTVARPNLTINDADDVISGGNPFARPERARGVDLYWEWYGRNGGFLSVGGFYKDVSDALFGANTVFGDTRFDAAPNIRSQYNFTTTVNGGDGYIWGFEAAAQLQVQDLVPDAGWLGGFGLITNVIFNRSQATTPDGRRVRFPGTSDWVFNVGPYFEKYGLSARVVYQKRTDWFSEVGGPDTGGDLYWATDDELDASVRYALTPNFEVYVEGGNLLNGPGRRFVGNTQRTLEWEKFGRRYQAGIRVTY